MFLIEINGERKEVTGVDDLEPEERDLLASRYLQSLIPPRKKMGSVAEDMRAIENLVCPLKNIEEKELKKRSRKREIVHARQIVMFLVKTFTKHTYKEIGEYYGKDHTTVIHACITVKQLAEVYESHRQELDFFIRETRMLI